ncbi:unnamed protein product [Amoebophrya sp. A120]|nr:unnamed protein product [Amoebophrya sp. A120]|eukprot:GSA120T00002229001.1
MKVVLLFFGVNAAASVAAAVLGSSGSTSAPGAASSSSSTGGGLAWTIPVRSTFLGKNDEKTITAWPFCENYPVEKISPLDAARILAAYAAYDLPLVAPPVGSCPVEEKRDLFELRSLPFTCTQGARRGSSPVWQSRPERLDTIEKLLTRLAGDKTSTPDSVNDVNLRRLYDECSPLRQAMSPDQEPFFLHCPGKNEHVKAKRLRTSQLQQKQKPYVPEMFEFLLDFILQNDNAKAHAGNLFKLENSRYSLLLHAFAQALENEDREAVKALPAAARAAATAASEDDEEGSASDKEQRTSAGGPLTRGLVATPRVAASSQEKCKNLPDEQENGAQNRESGERSDNDADGDHATTPQEKPKKSQDYINAMEFLLNKYYATNEHLQSDSLGDELVNVNGEGESTFLEYVLSKCADHSTQMAQLRGEFEEQDEDDLEEDEEESQNGLSDAEAEAGASKKNSPEGAEGAGGGTSSTADRNRGAAGAEDKKEDEEQHGLNQALLEEKPQQGVLTSSPTCAFLIPQLLVRGARLVPGPIQLAAEQTALHDVFPLLLLKLQETLGEEEAKTAIEKANALHIATKNDNLRGMATLGRFGITVRGKDKDREGRTALELVQSSAGLVALLKPLASSKDKNGSAQDFLKDFPLTVLMDKNPQLFLTREDDGPTGLGGFEKDDVATLLDILLDYVVTPGKGDALQEIEKVAYLNHQSPDTGRTAVFKAAMNLQWELYDALVAAGADDTVADKEGRVPKTFMEQYYKAKGWPLKSDPGTDSNDSGAAASSHGGSEESRGAAEPAPERRGSFLGLGRVLFSSSK